MSAVELHSAVIVAESEKAPLCEQVGLGAVLSVDKVKSFALALCGAFEIVVV